MKLTFCKHAVHVEPVGGAGLVKQRVTHVDAQLPGSLVLDHTRVCATDFIWKEKIKMSENKPLHSAAQSSHATDLKF